MTRGHGPGGPTALDDAIAELEHATNGLLKVAMGGTAVGTGLNAPAGFAERVPPDPDQQLPALRADPGRHVRPHPQSS
jgi:hypothetical protein